MQSPKPENRHTSTRGNAVAVIALLLLSACGGGSPPAPSAPPPIDPPVVDNSDVEALQQALVGLPFPEFLEESYRLLSLRNPEFVVRNGLAEQFNLSEVSLTNVSEAHRLVTMNMADAVLTQLERDFDREQLTQTERISFDTYRIYLEGEADGRDYLRYQYWAAEGLWGEQAATEQFFTDEHPLESRADADAYVERLTLVPAKFDQIIDNLTLSESEGIVEPSLTMNVALNSINSLLGRAPTANPYYTAFAQKLDAIASLSDAEKSTLRDAALAAVTDQVIPAYRALGDKLNQLLPSAPQSIGYGQYTGGSDYYDYLLGWYTTTDLTPDEVHQLGLDRLTEITQRMRAAFDALGYPADESLSQSFARLQADGGIVRAADVVDVNESLIATARSLYGEAFDVQPDHDVEVVGGPTCCFYVPAPVDGSRPGAFHLALADTPYYQIPTTAYHEAIPGHHLQLAVARQTDLPTFRNHIYSGAYIEGWGLYSEILAAELGWYDQDPIGDLGRLQAEAIRAVRLVLDTAIHSKGWSFNRAAQFFADNTGLSLQRGQGAAFRYSLIPGQATTYMVGLLKLLELRERAMNQLGDDFDLVEFHRVVLEQGAMPLPVLETVIDNYIASKID